MTGGWHNESARHALSARGIPTTSLRAVREVHSGRSVEERKADELGVEVYTEDMEEWMKAPDDFDIKGIDDPIPEGITIERQLFLESPNWMTITVKVTDADGEEKLIGHLDLERWEEGRNMFSIHLHIDRDFRSIGLSKFLMRDILNLADDEGYNLYGIIRPMDGSPLDNEGLAEYYRSFGFVMLDENIIYRPTQKEITREERP